MAAVLEVEFIDLFPQATKLLQKKEPGQFLSRSETRQVAELGIDPNPRYWVVKVMTRGGNTLMLPLDGNDFHRMFSALQRSDPLEGPYFVFDSNGRRVLLNMDNALLCHLMFEPRFMSQDDGPDERELLVELVTGPETLSFSVDYEFDSDEVGELAAMFMLADIADEGERSLVVNFTDIDGEVVFLRLADVSIMSVPIEFLEPGAIPEDEDDDDAPSKPPEGPFAGLHAV